MYFDRRLWQLTRGLRGRIAAGDPDRPRRAVVGIARFALLGVLLAARLQRRRLRPRSRCRRLGSRAPCCCAASLDHRRTVIAHRTASRVQEDLRGRLYDKIAELGPAWFAGERTGGVMLSVVDGVEQLQSFFGQYLPQVCVAALTPLAIFAFIVWWDAAGRDGDAGRGAGDARRADRLRTRSRARTGHGRHEAMKGFGSEFLDAVQGLPTLKAFGQSTRLWQAARRAGAAACRTRRCGCCRPA